MQVVATRQARQARLGQRGEDRIDQLRCGSDDIVAVAPGTPGDERLLGRRQADSDGPVKQQPPQVLVQHLDP
ncbi:hypothetical protein SDC9_151675 [bioreactor metagenome]|uniref:Uncharacterized protein n=1 Tax=bioreactor metagenome TaxID=1076179 RepID=A0A645ERG7_9ZZZZ